MCRTINEDVPSKKCVGAKLLLIRNTSSVGLIKEFPPVFIRIEQDLVASFLAFKNRRLSAPTSSLRKRTAMAH